MVTKENLEKEYKKLETKYALPSFEELDFEFEIYNFMINANAIPDHLLRTIRRRIVEKFYGWVNYLHTFIFPNQQSAIFMNEFSQFNDEEKAKIAKIISRIMFIARVSTKLEADLSEKKDAEFIQTHFKKYKELRQDLLEITEKNIESWKKSKLFEQEKRETNYYG